MANAQLLTYLEQFGPQKANGILSIQNPKSGEEGSICLSSGTIVSAGTSKLKDLAAVLAMLAWDTASVVWLNGQSPPILSCEIHPDLAIFEFVQLEMEHGTSEAVLSHLHSTVEEKAPKKRKTIRLPDLTNFSIHLQREDDPSGSFDFELREGNQLLGKGDDCDIIITHNTISRRHCQIAVVDRTIIMTDLGSTNGTYVNDQLIHQEFVVPGDKVTLGSINFLVAARLRRNLSSHVMPTSVPMTPQNGYTVKVPRTGKTLHWQNLGKDPLKDEKPDKSIIRRLLKKNT
jgi:pSer/pThr/pTyr-binding forkhead associated (FHA) protein